jgi:NAD(P)-dependent dehydrogenase (short-subunit alcohol dehydrogenase family)
LTLQQSNVELANQVAIVTGGGRGIGRTIAQALVKAGARVAVVARSQTELAETVSIIGDDRAMAVVVDVTDRNTVEQMVDEVAHMLGPIDLLVNNAGVYGPVGPVWEVNVDEWWQNINVNLRGIFLTTRTVLPKMIARRSGRIVHIASNAGVRPAPYSTAYRCSKAAVLRFTDCLALEIKDYGISVFAVHPGTVRTAMTEDLLESEAGQKWMPTFQKTFDNKQDVSSERCAELIVTLASGKADALTGRYIQVFDDIDDMVLRSKEILHDDLYTLRLRK